MPIPGAGRVLRVLATGTRREGEHVCMLDVSASTGDQFTLYLFPNLLDGWNRFIKERRLPAPVDLIITPGYSKYRTKVLRYDISFADPITLAATAS
jgi:hypothetical protein